MFIDVASGELVDVKLIRMTGGYVVLLASGALRGRGVKPAYFVPRKVHLDTLFAHNGVMSVRPGRRRALGAPPSRRLKVQRLVAA